MKTLFISAAFGAALVAPSSLSAQAIPPAIVAVVDVDRVASECNACKTAQAALHAQVTAEQTREKTLGSPLQTEQKSLQSAVDALKGAEPDAALQARVKAFQAKAQQAQDEVGRAREQVQRNEAYVNEQIQTKLNTVYAPVMQKRGANVLVDVRATLATAQSVDVTNDVLAALNSAMPSLSTTAPAQKAPPQGR